MGNSNGKEELYTSGYHILRVEENSPASKVGIEPFFDFIVAFNGVELTSVYSQFMDLLQENDGKKSLMTIYSSKLLALRTVGVTPTRNWGGKGLLGLNIRYCSFSIADDIILHILNVLPNSPAEQGGLIPHTDYIIGYDHISENVDFFDLVRESIGKPVNLFVYNSKTKKCRDVVVVPSETWGNESILGCDIGTGYLHRIPLEESDEPPIETFTHNTPPVEEEPKKAPVEIPLVPLPEPLPNIVTSSGEQNYPIVPEPLSYPAHSLPESNLSIDSIVLPPVSFIYSMPEGGYNIFTPVSTYGTSDIPAPSDISGIGNLPS